MIAAVCVSFRFARKMSHVVQVLRAKVCYGYAFNNFWEHFHMVKLIVRQRGLPS